MKAWIGGSVVMALAASACGTATPTSPGSSGSGTAAATVTITAAGAAPKQVTVKQGSRVLFINNDSVTHEMFSDPHPEHDACPEINAVGSLAPNEQRETENLNTVRTCGFHDHLRFQDSRLNGQIVITN